MSVDFDDLGFEEDLSKSSFPEDMDLDFNDDMGSSSFSDELLFDDSDMSNLGGIYLEKPKTGRILATVFTGLLISGILCLIVYGLYMNYVKYPAQQVVNETTTGIYCLNNWEESIKSMISLGEDSYIAQEVVYANGNQLKLDFYKKMLATVSYSPKKVDAYNVYGNPMIDRKTNEVVKIDSYVKEGESVVLSYIDYEGIDIDKDLLQKLMSEADLKLGDADYNNKLVDVFCKYMLSMSEIPMKKVDYVPCISSVQEEVEDGSTISYYSVKPEEDIYIDKLLFSSKEFHDLLNRFSVSAGEVSKGKTIKPTSKWSKWSKLSEEDKAKTKEPDKYSSKESINKLWCGTYYLKHEANSEGTSGITADLGDGTFENPASIGTSVLTYVLKTDKKGNTKAYPIRVKLVEFGVSSDAIRWFESKDERNRGIDVSSEVQFCYYKFEITNLSKKTLTIKDNSTLCDSSVMLSTRTGTIFGLQDSVKLKPDEVGIVESWSKSTELNKKYVIWGADFSRKLEPVWFRILAGNIDDDSEEKGVTINDSRNFTPTPTPTPTPVPTTITIVE